MGKRRARALSFVSLCLQTEDPGHRWAEVKWDGSVTLSAFWSLARPTSVRRHLVFSCDSLMTYDVAQLFMCLLAFCISF